MPLNLTDDKSTLVQVMAWCRQATSHYLSQSWPRFMSPYGVTRPQWVECWAHIRHTISHPIVYVWLINCKYRLSITGTDGVIVACQHLITGYKVQNMLNHITLYISYSVMIAKVEYKSYFELTRTHHCMLVRAGCETKIFWHSPELGSFLYTLYKIPLAQACFPLARPNFRSHWRAGKRYFSSQPRGHAMGCLLWVFWTKLTMMTSSNGNIFRVTGPWWGESTSHWWIPLTKTSDMEPWCFLSSAPEETVEQTLETLVISYAIALIMTSL